MFFWIITELLNQINKFSKELIIQNTLHTNAEMGSISKKGRIFLGKRIGPKSARRARKPLNEDWTVGRILNRYFVDKRKNYRHKKLKNNGNF